MPPPGDILIIGAGPAGLTAAYELSRHGVTGTIVEADVVVGGIARTVERDGYRFDLGGHRFFTKVKEIENLWDEMLGEPMLTRPRLSRIFYGGKFYDYPLKPWNALRNMGFFRATACMASYARAKVSPIKSPANYEQWVTNQFGKKLFRMFFKSYTEKVWGIPCDQIGADWAAQRIKGLSLGEAVRNALLGQRKNGGGVVKTLIDSFRYPRLGPGQLWENCTKTLVDRGWRVRMNTKVVGLATEGERVSAVTVRTPDGATETLPAAQVFSSMPLRSLLRGLTPTPPPDVLAAANKLAYRDFLVVALVIDAPDLFPDNWIYVHEPQVNVGRIQNFKNWSPAMVPDPAKTCLGMEYFVNEGDELWSMNDDDLVKLAYSELQKIGLAGGPLEKGYVVRVPKAYPVYDTGYQERLGTIREWVTRFDNLHCIGRNGQHRYNNQDHSMATALIAARNVTGDTDRDPWAVNEDAEYHEIAKTERQTPMRA
ncbi:MAG TPA: NAD(P)/FAD-dependent oxidoreductase [Tepidisphaeraceae bacterium]|nr:NAD(P)/FAD-dependent oxidoreductase [Tepidisphaeraceae bacterium]